MDSSSEPESETVYAPAKGRRRSLIEESVSDLPEFREPRTAQLRALESIYSALIRHGDAFGDMRIGDHFKPAEVDAPSQGSFREFDIWLSERGRDDLLDLPGIEDTSDGLRFVGLSESEAEDLGLTVPGSGVDSPTTAEPVEKIRSEPRTEALVAVDRATMPGSDHHSNLLELWREVSNLREATTEELASTRRLPSIEEYSDRLAALPGIDSRTVITTPEDIPIHTFQDILDARELFDNGRKNHHTETVWRYSGRD